MAGQKNSKLKLLYLKNIMEKYSDENHILNSRDISGKLLNYGIECERKSIYKDIEILIEYGMDIQKTRTPKNGFFLVSREFEPAEIRLLADAVRSANFISKKKTVRLLNKIYGLVSAAQAERLKQHIFVDNRNKCSNEELFYSIDALDTAIKFGKKVRLFYTERNLDYQFTAKDEKKEFVLSPYALIWSDGRYYLAANDARCDNTVNMRVDRIHSVEVLDERARHKPAFDIADYVAKNFNMFSGIPETVELRCKNEILEEMLDKFGEKAAMRKGPENRFYIRSDMSVNEGLVSWIMQFGDNIEVVFPRRLRDMISEKAKKVVNLYSENEDGELL